MLSRLGASLAAEAGCKSANGGGAGEPSSVQNLWTLWTCALLGDLQLTTKVYAERSSRLSLAPTTKDPNASNSFPLTTEEAAASLGAAAIAAVDLWSHLGMSDMAELQARRALRQLGVQASAPEVVTLGCKLAFLHVDEAAVCDVDHGTQSSPLLLLRRACLHSLALLERIKALFPASALPSPLRDALSVAKLYCCTYAAVAEQQWDKALRLAIRLSDACGVPLPATEAGNPTLGLGPPSVEQMKAGLLLVKVMGHFDPASAQKMFSF